MAQIQSNLQGTLEMEQVLYEFSTELDADKHGYNGFVRITLAAEGAQLIRFYPPNPSHSGLFSACRKMAAMRITVQNLVLSPVQMNLQMSVQNFMQKVGRNVLALRLLSCPFQPLQISRHFFVFYNARCDGKNLSVLLSNFLIAFLLSLSLYLFCSIM